MGHGALNRMDMVKMIIYMSCMIAVCATCKISGFYLVYVAKQAGLSYDIFENPKERISREEAHTWVKVFRINP